MPHGDTRFVRYLLLCQPQFLTGFNQYVLFLPFNLIRHKYPPSSYFAEYLIQRVILGQRSQCVFPIGISGSIAINGGNIIAKGGEVGALTGFNSAIHGIVTINNGTVTATGGDNHYGGGDGIGGSVTINGGTVTAIGGDSAYEPGSSFNGLTGLPNSYIYWTNTAPIDPGGGGEVFSNGAGVPFVNSASYMFVRIESFADDYTDENGDADLGGDADVPGLPDAGFLSSSNDEANAVKSISFVLALAVIVVSGRIAYFAHRHKTEKRKKNS